FLVGMARIGVLGRTFASFAIPSILSRKARNPKGVPRAASLARGCCLRGQDVDVVKEWVSSLDQAVKRASLRRREYRRVFRSLAKPSTAVAGHAPEVNIQLLWRWQNRQPSNVS